MSLYQKVLIAFLLVYMFLLFKKGYAIKRLYFLKANYIIMLFIFSVAIVNLFGLNSEILINYEKNGTSPYNYDWFKPEDVMAFPFDQLDAWRDRPKLVDIDVSGRPDDPSAPINYVIVVDKTLSTVLSPAEREVLNQMKTQLKSELANPKKTRYPDKEPTIQPVISDKLEISDLMALKFIRTIYQSRFTNVTYQIWLYYGDDECVPFADLPYKANKSTVLYKDAVMAYLNTAKENEDNASASRRTDFWQLFQKVIYPGIDQTVSQPSINNIVLLSDFEHEPESGTSFSDLNMNLDNALRETQIDKISLVKLENAHPKFELSSATIDVIKKHFVNSLIYNFSEAEIITDKKANTYFNALVATTKIEKLKTLYFFYPDRSRNAQNGAKAIFTLKWDSKNSDCLFTFNNNYYNTTELSNLRMNNRYDLWLNQPVLVDCNDFSLSGLQFAVVSGDLPHDNNFLDVSSPDDMMTKRIPILFIEKIPRTTAILLCTCYLFIAFLLCLNALFYIYLSARSVLFKFNSFAFSRIDEDDGSAKIPRTTCVILILLELFILWELGKLLIYYGKKFIQSTGQGYLVIGLMACYLVAFIMGVATNHHFRKHGQQ